MTDADELFETFDGRDNPLGLMRRAEVHRVGVWHRAVNVLLFDADGLLYLQRRSSGKDVGADLWDLSAAEHLHPGESFAAGALRGLAEELGVTGVSLTAYPGTFRNKLEDGAVRDWEVQRCYHGRYSGRINFDPDEVAEVQRIDRASLARSLDQAPEDFTPWFRQRIVDLDLLDEGWPG